MTILLLSGSLNTSPPLNDIDADPDCKLLTSKQLAAILGVTEGALRKQRSKANSIFKYAKIGKRVFYPTDLIVQTIHQHVIGV